MSRPKRIAVHVHSWGEVSHPEGDFEVDREYYRQMLDSFRRFRQHQPPPVLQQHGKKGDGLRWGVVEQITTAEQGTDLPIENEIDNRGIWAVIQMSEPLYQLWDDGLIDGWSPGVHPRFESRHDDEVYPNLLRELSFVSLEHQHNTRTPNPAYTLSDEGVAIPLTDMEDYMKDEDQKKENQEGVDELKGSVETLREEVNALRSQLESMLEKMKSEEGDDSDEAQEPDEDEETEMGDDTTTDEEVEGEPSREMSAQADRIRQLEQRLAETERERTREKARAEINDRNVELEDAERADLIELACTDSEAFTAAINVMERAHKKAEQAAEKRAKEMADNTGRFNFGEVGATGQPSTDTSGELRQMCDKIVASVDADEPARARKIARRRLQQEGLNWGDAEQARAAREALDAHFSIN